MNATLGAAGLAVLALLLDVTGVVSFPWLAWLVLALAVASGVALDAVRRRA